jgi:hypothetical protein
MERSRRVFAARGSIVIDEADDRTTLARLARVVARRYTADPCAGALVEWIRRRGVALTPTTPTGAPNPEPPRAA